MNERYDVLIVGAGQGGSQAAMVLRQQGFAGTVALVGDEPEPPYERPALSKEYLAGDKPFDKLLLHAPHAWEARAIELRLARRVVEVDAGAHRVRLEDGTTLEYGKLVWAAGGSPRQLPAGHELRGVHTVRARADVDRLRADLGAASRVVVIGGGYIGLEAAAVLTKLGKRVTVVEAAQRVLSRVAGEAVSRFYEDEHRARGVDVRLGAKVLRLDGTAGAVSGVRLEGGEVLSADVVVVGVGIAPNVGPLVAAGARAADGVVVDLRGKTSLPDVYALGDCASHPNVHAPEREALVRLESVQNANDQAAVVAKALVGKGDRYDAIPWFWSNQWELRLQTVGLSQGHDRAVVRGSVESRRFSVVYFRRKKVVAIDCVNAMKDYVQGKALIASGRVIDPRAVARADVELKTL